MNKQEAFKIVLKDLTDCGCGLFVGKYDARNGSDKFMHGILTVIEHIAYKAGTEEYEEFLITFLENFQKSVDKAQGK